MIKLNKKMAMAGDLFGVLKFKKSSEQLEKEIDKELSIVKKFSCYNDLVKYNYVEKTNDLHEKAKNLLSFLGISSFKLLEKNYRQNEPDQFLAMYDAIRDNKKYRD